jgi:hypothetical protein
VTASQCRWSGHNVLAASELVTQLRDRVTILGVVIQRDKVLPVMEYQYLGDRVYAPTDETRVRFGFTRSPETWFIDEHGVLRAKWSGAYTDAVSKSIERTFLGLRLPRLMLNAKSSEG